MRPAGTFGSLAARAGAGLGWNIAGGVVRALAGLVINTILARVLGPEPFGQLALVTVVIGMGSLLVDAGLGVSLIQQPAIDEFDVRQAFTAQLGLGLLLAAVLAFAAPWGAALLGQESVTPVLRLLPALLAIQAFGQTGTALLRRAGDFRRVQQLQIGSYLAGYLGAGIPLALRDAGVWSLVAAQLAQATVYSAGVWLVTRHSVRLFFGLHRRSAAAFGLTITASNVAAWAVSALPALLIGRFQGVVALGYFSRAFFLVSMPASVLAMSLQTTSLTLYSRAQRHPRVTARLCLALTALCLMATAPPFLIAAAMPRAIVETLFGDRWLPMAVLLPALALAMPLDCVAALTGPLLIARGRPGVELRVQILTALSTLIVVGGLAIWTSTEAVVWGVLGAVYLLRAVLAVAAMLRETGVPFARWARAVVGPLALGFVCFAGVRMLEPALAGSGVPAWLRLLLLGGAAGLPLLLGGLTGANQARTWAARMVAHV